MSRERLKSIHYFRGIAILFIVLGHCVTISGWETNSFPEKAFANLLMGGTPLFVFISGFLFHHIYCPQFRFGPFLWKKAKNVLSPYLVLSLLAVGLIVFIEERRPYADVMYANVWGGGPAGSVVPLLLYVWTGATLIGYWYVPFIMATFAMAPLHERFARWPLTRQVAAAAALWGLALFSHRPVDGIGVLRHVLYFAPLYLLGMICSIHRERLYAVLEKKEWLFGAAALALAAVQGLRCDFVGGFHKELFHYGGIDLQLLQKTALCFFFLGFLRRWEKVEIAPLDFLASASFALYFIHPWFLHLVQRLVLRHSLEAVPGVVSVPLITLAVLGGSAWTARAVKRALGARSRFLIGW